MRLTQSSSYDNTERAIAAYFGGVADDAPLSPGFWPRLRARLTVSSDIRSSRWEAVTTLWQMLTARPLVAVTAASLVALALVSAIAVPSLIGSNARGELASFAGNADREPTAPAGATGAPGNGAVDDMSNDALFTVGTYAAKGANEANDASSSPQPATAEGGASAPANQTALETAGRSIISTSSLAIEVDSVPSAMDQLRTIANSAGGFIETLSTTGGADPDRGNATVRVPGSTFLDTLQRVKQLGTVTGESVGSDDVTEQVIDLGARLRSELAKEASFLELLDRADSVSDLLSIERELSRVRTEIERLTGQLSFIEQRVDLATIHVNFGQPAALTSAPPAASLAVGTRNVEDAVAQLKAIVDQAEGEVDSTSIVLNNGVVQAYVAIRVSPAAFEDTLSRVTGLGEVTAKEIRTPGIDSDLPESDEATAKITVTMNQVEPSRNWWLWAGAPAGVVAMVLLLAITYKIGRARNRS
jgi:hypothetical protein